MVTEAWPRTCLRAGQSSVTITLVLPALSGLKYSVQVRVEPAGIRLKPARAKSDVRRIWHIFGVISKKVKDTRNIESVAVYYQGANLTLKPVVTAF